MRRIIESVLVLVVLASVAAQTAAQASSASAGASVADTIYVAPPTGERETDRASILAALDEVEPGGTVRFAPGTYLVGEIIRISTPELTLLGHPDGTALRGCDGRVYEEIEARIARGAPRSTDWAACGLLELTGGYVTVRNLTFELSRLGLLLGCCHLERRFQKTDGGYLIERNTFRNSLNGIRPWATEPSTIRGNRFINTFHAISGAGGGLRVLDNEISVPEPEDVPGIGHPSFAIAWSSIPRRWAEALEFGANGQGLLIEGNRIEGHPDGILLSASPGTAIRHSQIRDNVIVTERVPLPRSALGRSIVEVTDTSDATVVGIPVTLEPARPFPGPPAEGVAEGRFEENVIAGNHLIGAVGVGLAIRRGARNLIVDNTISEVTERQPFPGNTVISSAEQWREANGSGIWISSGSDDNQILGNIFEDVVGAQISIEGDHNVVVTGSAEDEVWDRGEANRVTARTGEARPEEAVERAIRAYLDDFAAQDPEAWREHISHDFLIIENGYPVEPDRFTAAWDPANPWGQTYRLHDLQIDVHGGVAVYRFDLGWYESGNRVSWGVESGHARLVDGEWRLVQNHMTWLPPRGEVEPEDLRDYVGEYQGLDFEGRDYRMILFLQDDRLYMRRPDGGAVAAGVGRVQMIPGPAEDQFFVEFVNGEARFQRDRDGSVTGFLYALPLEVLPGLPDQLEYEKVR